MLTIHKQQNQQCVTIPLAEFSKLVEYCREVEPIELIDITNTCDDFMEQEQSKDKKTPGKIKTLVSTARFFTNCPQNVKIKALQRKYG